MLSGSLVAGPRLLIVLATVLAAAVVALVPVGCGLDGEPVVVSTPTATPSAPGTQTAQVPLEDITLTFELVADGFEQPLFATGAGDGSGRLFVVEKTGHIWVVRNGDRLPEPFLDLSGTVSTKSEQGLLGVAFYPDYAESGLFCVDYTRADGATVVSRFFANGDAADPASEDVILTVAQPYANHNGGMIAFGPGDYLYVGLGDGGSGGDPQQNGQNLSTLLGAILRIDVTRDNSEQRTANYGIPNDNPFVGTSGARGEIWVYGLRNPWRFSFDRETGDLWIGDVGQGSWEEIDLVPAGSAGGDNFGWNVYEATHPFADDAAAKVADFVMPTIEYGRDAGSSVTGGYVYRGSASPGLAGAYIYGDFVSGRIWALRLSDDESTESALLAETDFAISSFAEDDEGELYVIDFGGAVYRLSAE